MTGTTTKGRLVHHARAQTAASAAALVTAVSMALAIGSASRWASGGIPSPVISVTAPRVIVIKSKRVLHLLDGDRLVRTYSIDLGNSPVGPKRRKGDGRTPVGRFRVIAKNAESPYYRFIGLDYPDIAATEWGLANGLISDGEAASIRQALATGGCPSWSTALGGGIGIHGRRVGRDWTGGCIALADEHIEELFSVLRIGDPVEVLP